MKDDARLSGYESEQKRTRSCRARRDGKCVCKNSSPITQGEEQEQEERKIAWRNVNKKCGEKVLFQVSAMPSARVYVSHDTLE